MTKQKDLPDGERYKLYIDERKLLVDAEREGARTFDKAILTLASGAFGFSIAFLDRIVRDPTPNTLYLLMWSWVLFSLSLIVILFSFLASQMACRSQREIIYEELVANTSTKQSNKWGIVTDICNFASIAILAFAFIFLGCFVYRNKIYTQKGGFNDSTKENRWIQTSEPPKSTDKKGFQAAVSTKETTSEPTRTEKRVK